MIRKEEILEELQKAGVHETHTVKTKHDLLMSYINKKRSTGGVKP